jgi:hypothetical protein
MNDKRRVFVDDVEDGASKGFKGWTFVDNEEGKA